MPENDLEKTTVAMIPKKSERSLGSITSFQLESNLDSFKEGVGTSVRDESNQKDQKEANWKLKQESMREGMEEPNLQGNSRGCWPLWSSSNKVHAYYEKQTEILDGLQEVDDLLSKHGSAVIDEPEVTPEKHVSFAINISNLANVLLLVSKLPLCALTGSLAIIASVLDSVMDLFVGLLLWVARRAVKNENKYKFPIGKSRMQPLSVLTFAAIMGTVSVQIMTQGATEIMFPKPESGLPPLRDGMQLNSLLVIIIMGSNILLKLFLWLYCRTFENEIVKASPQNITDERRKTPQSEPRIRSQAHRSRRLASHAALAPLPENDPGPNKPRIVIDSDIRSDASARRRCDARETRPCAAHMSVEELMRACCRHAEKAPT